MLKSCVVGACLFAASIVAVAPAGAAPGMMDRSMISPTIETVPAQYRPYGYGVRRPYYRRRGFPVGAGIAAGVAAGALLGGALSAAGQAPYAEAPVGPVQGEDADYCASRFRSYDPSTGTYRGFDGLDHPCP